jgi:hypothetical protein
MFLPAIPTRYSVDFFHHVIWHDHIPSVQTQRNISRARI